MAGTRTIAQLARGITGVRVFPLLVRVGFVVAGVTARAIWPECRITPVNNVGVVLVALSARQVAAMILRLITQPRMTIIGWRPGDWIMADTTVLPRTEMPWILACRNCAVVARRAGTEHLVVINIGYGRPRVAAVTVFADIRCLHMQWPLACRIRTVMTA